VRQAGTDHLYDFWHVSIVVDLHDAIIELNVVSKNLAPIKGLLR